MAGLATIVKNLLWLGWAITHEMALLSTCVACRWARWGRCHVEDWWGYLLVARGLCVVLDARCRIDEPPGIIGNNAFGETLLIALPALAYYVALYGFVEKRVASPVVSDFSSSRW